MSEWKRVGKAGTQIPIEPPTRHAAEGSVPPSSSVDESVDEAAELAEAIAASKAAVAEEDERAAKREEAELAAVLAASMLDPAEEDRADDEVEEQALRAAIEASLTAGPSGSDGACDDDDEMRAVLASSLAAAEEQRKVDEAIERLQGGGGGGSSAASLDDCASSTPAPPMPPPADLVDPGTCPLCMEELDETDRALIACPCEFPLCLFCYGKLKEEGTADNPAACPGCRLVLGEPQYRNAPARKKGSKPRGRAQRRS
jgi:hypothetical protein